MASKKLVLCFNGATIQERERIFNALPPYSGGNGFNPNDPNSAEPSFINSFVRLQNELGG